MESLASENSSHTIKQELINLHVHIFLIITRLVGYHPSHIQSALVK